RCPHRDLHSFPTRRSSDLGRLRAVVLGIANQNGPIPRADEAYDPKSLEHIIAGTYPVESDMVYEMEAFREVLERYGVTVYRPQLDRKSTRLNSSHVKTSYA